MLARGATDRERTRVFARYSLIGAMSSAGGALAAGDPGIAGRRRHRQDRRIQAVMFCCYGGARAVWPPRFIARLPPSHAEDRAGEHAARARRAAWSTSSRRCSASTPLPAASSCNRCWRCGCSSVSTCRCAAASLFFFWTSVLGALSFPLAGWPRPAFRPGQHHGVHSHPVEPVPDRWRRSRPISPSFSACFWCARRCRRWTCRRAPHTSWPW